MCGRAVWVFERGGGREGKKGWRTVLAIDAIRDCGYVCVEGFHFVVGVGSIREKTEKMG